MSRAIVLKFKDGSSREFKERGRAGGSYTIHGEYRGSFFVVIDEWYNETAFPASDITEVHIETECSW